MRRWRWRCATSSIATPVSRSLATACALAACAALAFGVSVGPQHWTRKLCDAIAINTAAAAVCGGLLLALAGWLRHRDRITRIAAVLGSAAGTLAVLLLLEPRCMRGPLAMVDPAIWPIWLGEVREMQPLLSVFRKNPLTASAIAAFPAAALVAVAILLRQERLRRDFGFLTAVLVFCRGGGHHGRRDPRLFLCDLARHAVGCRAGAAADSRRSKSSGWCRGWRLLWF